MHTNGVRKLDSEVSRSSTYQFNHGLNEALSHELADLRVLKKRKDAGQAN